MPSDRAAFKKKFGVSPDQHFILTKVMRDETVTRAMLGNNMVQQLHRLVNEGLMVYVPSPTDKAHENSWRLTEAGRNLLKRW